MEGKLELYQQELDTASKPVSARLEHYQKTTYEIKKLLNDFFFNATRTQKLTEAAQENEVVFSFNQVKAAMEACLTDEVTLLETAQKTKSSAGHPSLVAAFDVHVARSGLPIEFQKDNSFYIFKPENPYTSTAQAFMQQFAYALSVYRVCLGIFELYSTLFNHPVIQTQHLKNYIESAQNLKPLLDGGEVDLLALHKHAKALKKEIVALLRTEKIHEGINTFKKDVDLLVSQLVVLLEFGAVHLQNGYMEFPNNAKLWWYHDRSWHALLKTLTGLLYANQYTYSTYYGTFEVKKEFIGVIKSEIEHFDTVALAKMPLLKIELLRKAAKLTTASNIDILSTLAEQGIELIEAPQVGMFSTSSAPSFYHLMAAVYTQKRVDTSVEEANQNKRESFYFN